MQMKDVMAATNLSRDTIRFYEKEGLLAAPVRGQNGYRHYDDGVVKQLKLIIRAKHLGFTLKEIKSLNALLYQRSLTPKELAKHLREKRAEVSEKIEQLQNIQREIDLALAGMCEQRESLSG
ncbi:MerR family transcriptional regulator [Oceanobacter kriegii]|uniref:MerR family transcriptional regulator n=1 Tax=Oceanobacter kriegii TaxID=64972 RepID=UPI0004141533|nr:MerR family transcriptional regulator [Oceanobacter kriegii]